MVVPVDFSLSSKSLTDGPNVMSAGLEPKIKDLIEILFQILEVEFHIHSLYQYPHFNWIFTLYRSLQEFEHQTLLVY